MSYLSIIEPHKQLNTWYLVGAGFTIVINYCQIGTSKYGRNYLGKQSTSLQQSHCIPDFSRLLRFRPLQPKMFASGRDLILCDNILIQPPTHSRARFGTRIIVIASFHILSLK
jgi:hypothetical protein